MKSIPVILTSAVLICLAMGIYCFTIREWWWGVLFVAGFAASASSAGWSLIAALHTED